MDFKFTKLLIADRPVRPVLKDRDPISEDLGGEASGSIVEDLTSLQSEFAQLSELDEMEGNYTRKLIESLKLLQSEVDAAMPLKKESLGPAHSAAKEAYLASDCVVVIVGEDDAKTSIPLSRFEPRYVLSIVKEATPVLAQIISERRKEVGSRVDLLERILKEVKKAGNMAKQPERATPRAVEDDLIQNSITSG
jgi:hypothetical protein